MKELILDLLSDFEENQKELNDNQKQWLQDNYNRHMNFNYAVSDNYYIIETNEHNYNTMLYYLGLEYESDHLEITLNVNGIILLAYSFDSERIESLFERLESI